MLAAAGALAPELLGQLGAIPASTALPWFEAGGLFSSTPGQQQQQQQCLPGCHVFVQLSPSSLALQCCMQPLFTELLVSDSKESRPRR
jgi:hypothetical protein